MTASAFVAPLPVLVWATYINTTRIGHHHACRFSADSKLKHTSIRVSLASIYYATPSGSGVSSNIAVEVQRYLAAFESGVYGANEKQSAKYIVLGPQSDFLEKYLLFVKVNLWPLGCHGIFSDLPETYHHVINCFKGNERAGKNKCWIYCFNHTAQFNGKYLYHRTKRFIL